MKAGSVYLVWTLDKVLDGVWKWDWSVVETWTCNCENQG